MRILRVSNLNTSKQGFTLIELLIVLMIIGILAAVALPNFLNQSVKASQAEAKQVMKTVNQAQSLYRAQNTQFASSFDELAVGIVKSAGGTAQTEKFTYVIATADAAQATLLGTPKDSAAKAYSGGILRYLTNGNEAGFVADFCEADSSGIPPVEVTLLTNQIQCPAQFKNIADKN